MKCITFPIPIAPHTLLSCISLRCRALCSHTIAVHCGIHRMHADDEGDDASIASSGSNNNNNKILASRTIIIFTIFNVLLLVHIAIYARLAIVCAAIIVCSSRSYVCRLCARKWHETSSISCVRMIMIIIIILSIFSRACRVCDDYRYLEQMLVARPCDLTSIASIHCEI